MVNGKVLGKGFEAGALTFSYKLVTPEERGVYETQRQMHPGGGIQDPLSY